jgi:CBS domain-containing protein
MGQFTALGRNPGENSRFINAGMLYFTRSSSERQSDAGETEATMNRALRTVNDILQLKGREIWAVAPETTVYEALQLMADKGIGAVVVMADHRLMGVMSERDYARKVILLGKASRDTAVREIMTEKVITVFPSTSVEECMALMTQRRIRHLPVTDEGNLIGLISIGDVVKAIISEQQFVIEHYRNMWEYAQP